MAVIEQWLKQYGYQVPGQKTRDMQQEWYLWYRGYVSGFHDYKVYNGVKHVTEKRYRLGMAKVVCEDFANLLVNEHMMITCDAMGDKLHEMLRGMDFHTRLNRLSELVMAMGCGALVAFLDKDGKPVVDFVRGDMVYPLSWDGDDVQECAFASRKVMNTTTGVVNGYYVQLHIRDGNGWRVHNAILDEAGNELVLPEDMMADTPVSPVPLFQILRPNTINTADQDSPLGASVFADAIDQLKACDLVYDSYINEFVLGKKRMMVPLSLARIMAEQDGTMRPFFDPNDTLMYVYSSEEAESGKPFEVDMKLRTAEHEQGLQRCVDMLSKKCGLGVGRYRFDGGTAMKTATEVISQKSDLYQSIEKHRKPFGAAIIGCVRALAWLTGCGDNVDVCVNFDDSIIEDTNATIDRSIKLVDAGLCSKRDAIMNIYKLCEADAERKLEEINAESRVTQGAIEDFFLKPEQ